MAEETDQRSTLNRGWGVEWEDRRETGRCAVQLQHGSPPKYLLPLNLNNQLGESCSGHMAHQPAQIHPSTGLSPLVDNY